MFISALYQQSSGMSSTMDWQIKPICANFLAFIRRPGPNIFIKYGGRNDMGMFDTLLVRCKKCNKVLEFQSKAGRCMMEEYNLSDVPSDIAGSLDGESQECRVCGCLNTIRTKVFVYIE